MTHLLNNRKIRSAKLQEIRKMESQRKLIVAAIEELPANSQQVEGEHSS
jgi:hypothetical protein